MHLAFVTYKEEPGLLKDDQVLASYLAEKNISVTPTIWDNIEINWQEYDVIILRSMWDYFKRFEEFNAWLDKLALLGCIVLNPIAIVKWNQNKKYFDDLSNRGMFLPPYQFCLQNNFISLTNILKDRQWEKAVVKPAVSGGSFNTWVTTTATAEVDEVRFLEMMENSDVIVQKFMEEIIEEGELSLIYFNKKFSHAILKKARKGDFRVQSQFGGTVERMKPGKGILKQGAALLNNIPEPLLYARIDGLLVNHDQFYLMELELIEPALWFSSYEKACENFYKALVQIVSVKKH